MRLRRTFFTIAALSLSCAALRAADLGDLKAEVERLRKEINQKQNEKSTPISRVDAVNGMKYGPNSVVSTKAGKLQIGGLVQVWYTATQNDNIGIVKPADGNALDQPEGNEFNDNDSFRIRRTELRFTIDIHENINAYVMIDPSREHNVSYPPLPTFPAHNAVFGTGFNVGSGRGLQQGGTNNIIPQILQDAYINFHDFVPHHDFTIGQFKPPSGEEAWRNSGQLEFVERAMVTTINNVRDIGAMVHGTWLENRVQYWVGAFNGPDGTVLTEPDVVEGGNRSDDNDEKDIAWRIAVRPVWNPGCWHGRLELGYARTDGIRGEAGQGSDIDGTDVGPPNNALNREQTDINRQSAWAWYRPGGEVRGWWLRGEWGSSRDRYSLVRNTRTNLLLIGGAADGDGNVIGQTNPRPVTASGWYFGTGYKLSDSRWAEDLRNGGTCARVLHDMEFAFRYEIYENIAAEDLVQPDRHTDLFKTQVYTAGVNWYIKGHDAKIQANYLWIDEPSDNNPSRGLREVRNNTFVVAFQVMF